MSLVEGESRDMFREVLRNVKEAEAKFSNFNRLVEKQLDLVEGYISSPPSVEELRALETFSFPEEPFLPLRIDRPLPSTEFCQCCSKRDVFVRRKSLDSEGFDIVSLLLHEASLAPFCRILPIQLNVMKYLLEIFKGDCHRFSFFVKVRGLRWVTRVLNDFIPVEPASVSAEQLSVLADLIVTFLSLISLCEASMKPQAGLCTVRCVRILFAYLLKSVEKEKPVEKEKRLEYRLPELFEYIAKTAPIEFLKALDRSDSYRKLFADIFTAYYTEGQIVMWSITFIRGFNEPPLEKPSGIGLGILIGAMESAWGRNDLMSFRALGTLLSHDLYMSHDAIALVSQVNGAGKRLVDIFRASLNDDYLKKIGVRATFLFLQINAPDLSIFSVEHRLDFINRGFELAPQSNLVEYYLEYLEKYLEENLAITGALYTFISSMGANSSEQLPLRAQVMTKRYFSMLYKLSFVLPPMQYLPAMFNFLQALSASDKPLLKHANEIGLLKRLAELIDGHLSEFDPLNYHLALDVKKDLPRLFPPCARIFGAKQK